MPRRLPQTFLGNLKLYLLTSCWPGEMGIDLTLESFLVELFSLRGRVAISNPLKHSSSSEEVGGATSSAQKLQKAAISDATGIPPFS